MFKKWMLFLVTFCPVFVLAEGGPYKFYVCKGGTLVASSPSSDRALQDVQEFLSKKREESSENDEDSENDVEKMGMLRNKVKTEEEKHLNSKEIQKIFEEAGLKYALDLPKEEQKERVAFLTSDHNTGLKEKEEKLPEISVTVPDDSISFFPTSEKVEVVLKSAGLKADFPALKASEQRAQAV